jgi:lysophospholipase
LEHTEFLSAAELRPPSGSIHWVTAQDGVRLRLALWPKGDRGTVLIFSGRTEYIEKYGPAAKELGQAGFATATLDWRGQGLSQRVHDDPTVGHVGDFSHYQDDVNALLKAVQTAGLPQPYYLLAHSLGGAIGLRALVEGLDVNAVVFSAPMWTIKMSPIQRVFAFLVGHVTAAFGVSHLPAPFLDRENYVQVADFAGNALTHDRAMWDWMVEMVTKHPELGLGRPTCGWIHQAQLELADLATRPLPDVPVWVTCGDEETIVDKRPIRHTAGRWPSAELTMFERCGHEIIIETPDLRSEFMARTIAHFGQAN